MRSQLSKDRKKHAARIVKSFGESVETVCHAMPEVFGVQIQEENAELRLKQRHLLASMNTWQDHLEALVGNTVRSSLQLC